MALYHLERRFRIARGLDEVFAFFADAQNLEAITPPWLRFRILSGLPIEMRTGALIRYRLRLRGIPVRWQTKITVWEPPRRFVDEQLSGPFRQWIHEHTFEETDAGTWVRDSVRYRVPLGVCLHRLFVRRDLERIFDYRQETVARLLEGRGSVLDAGKGGSD